jgi:Uncharacterized protein conserved in bacteria
MATDLKLKEIIEPIVKANDLVLYDVIWTQDGSMKILQVSIMDKNGNMDIDTCAKISGIISDKLDALDVINYEYYLEVCSPGAERELKSDEEVRTALNEYVYVKLTNPKAGIDEVLGYLRAVNDTSIEIEYLVKNIKKKIEVEKNNIRYIRLSVKL